jgi:transcriptional regulator with XRE-family HTH domain
MSNKILKQRIKEKGLTQGKVANELEIDRVSLCEKMRNTKKHFNFFEKYYLAKRLNINISEIETLPNNKEWDNFSFCQKFFLADTLGIDFKKMFDKDNKSVEQKYKYALEILGKRNDKKK